MLGFKLSKTTISNFKDKEVMPVTVDATILTRNEDVTDFVIGEFRDERLLKTAALLFKKVATKMTTSLKKLAGNRALQVAFGRLLYNDKFTISEIEMSLAARTNDNCNNKHVLCIQDTVEVNYSTHPEKKIKFGINRSKKKKEDGAVVRGFLAHPGLIVDSANNDILGLSSVKVWTRGDKDLPDKKQRPIEEKESYKWLETAESAKNNLTSASMLTIIGDRESDIYELFDRIPDHKTHLIVRSYRNRNLHNGMKVDAHMEEIPVSGDYEINLPAITGVRKERKATIEVKFSTIELKAPKDSKSKMKNKTVRLTCIEAREVGTAPSREKPIFWRLYATHEISSLEEARQIIIWYSWRWGIEQVFRTMKKRGLDIEDNEIVEPQALLKLFVLGIAAAIKVLCLVNARDGSTKQPASNLFSEEELVVLAAVLLKVNGSTKKQQNPYITNSLSWASWIIARLGSWNGYACERPPGPITMYNGLEIFNHYANGWRLAQKDVCIR